YPIIKAVPSERQLLLFSATLRKEVMEKARSLMESPALINLVARTRTASTLEHIFFMAEERMKTKVLQELAAILQPNRALVFINHNEGVGGLTKGLEQLGLSTAGLHSAQSDQERKRVLELFRRGKVRYLVTTDLLARGLDVPGIDYVFNYDVPFNEEHYIHRVGRTGRAGNKGVAVTLVTTGQKFIMGKYSKQLKVPIKEYGIAKGKVFPVVRKVERHD
ncbi:MAG TPA: DEAD/DEAH box helicase, partial [Bacillota bacterium]|nr:DEAD/DEAH box helicase [Bacillota bacterium]